MTSSQDSGSIRIRRVYEDPDGGRRVLVDRLWPRGVRKDALPLDDWNRDVAPSDELRRAFHGGGMDFEEFSELYRDELRGDSQEAVRGMLQDWADSGTDELVLLYAARDPDENHAAVLAEHLRRVNAQWHP